MAKKRARGKRDRMRPIPAEIKTGGLIYEIRQIPKAELNQLAGSGVLALADHDQLIVYLRKEARLAAKWRSLFHEIPHVMGTAQNESEAEVQSGLWHQVIVDLGLLDR